ncbi:MAG: hypothetical protein R3A10_01350 [Caldilineaceae bacterium]
MSLTEYKPGSAFPGTIGRTVAESTPAWPAPNRADAGLNVIIFVLDDVGYGQMSAFGGLVQHTEPGAARRAGAARNIHYSPSARRPGLAS